MLTLLPTLSIQPLKGEDCAVLLPLLNQQLEKTVYSQSCSLEDIQQLLQPPKPASIYPVRWLNHQRFCAWRAGILVGFLDAAIGFDSDHLDLPDHQAQGLCRFVALTERAELQDETLRTLIDAAEKYWREHKVRYLVAFSLNTGYPIFQVGAGILPSNWATPVRVLTGLGYTFTQRYYLMQRPLANLLSEEVPQEDLLLEIQRSATEFRYQLYYRRVDQVAQARWVRFQTSKLQPFDFAQDKPASCKVAHIAQLFVNEVWRNRNIGKWLLRRMINDATLSDCTEIIVFPATRHATAIPLFNQQGFIEQDYRGYTLEKELQ